MASSRRESDDDGVESPEPSTPANCDPAIFDGETSLYGQFIWTVALPAAPADKDSLADISKIRQFSDVFEVGGYEWKLEMYPYGDSQSDKTLSVFLCAVDRKQRPGWSQTAHYQIAVLNRDSSKTSTHTGYDVFRGKRDSAWGWSKLMSLAKLHDPSQGFVDALGKITLQASVHVVSHEYMPVARVYRKSLCGLYYERVLQSYFEPFLKDELQRLDKLCGNGVLHRGFADFWASLPESRRRALLQITMDEVLLNVKARLFSRDQPATYLAADVIFKAAHDCAEAAQGTASPEAGAPVPCDAAAQRGSACLAVISGGASGGEAVLRLERLGDCGATRCRVEGQEGAGGLRMAATHGVMRLSNPSNFVDVFRTQVSETLDCVRALAKHLKPQSCDGNCLEGLGRQMLAVFAMCGMYITNVHPAYHEKLALQLQEDLIREEEDRNRKLEAKKAKMAEKKKKQQEVKAQKKAEADELRRRAEEEDRRRRAEAEAKRKAQEEEQARKKAEARRKAQEEAERQRKQELEEEERRAAAAASAAAATAAAAAAAAAVPMPQEASAAAAQGHRSAQAVQPVAAPAGPQQPAAGAAPAVRGGQSAAAAAAAAARVSPPSQRPPSCTPAPAAAASNGSHRSAAESQAVDGEQVRRQQIAGIMRDGSLSAVERQARIQAILAGKVPARPPAAAAAAPPPLAAHAAAPAATHLAALAAIHPSPVPASGRQDRRGGRGQEASRRPATAPAPAPPLDPALGLPLASALPIPSAAAASRPRPAAVPVGLSSSASGLGSLPLSAGGALGASIKDGRGEVDVEAVALCKLYGPQPVGGESDEAALMASMGLPWEAWAAPYAGPAGQAALASGGLTSLGPVPAYVPYPPLQGSLPGAAASLFRPAAAGPAAPPRAAGSRLFERWGGRAAATSAAAVAAAASAADAAGLLHVPPAAAAAVAAGDYDGAAGRAL